MDWSSGYVSDVNYTHGYYPGLNPLTLNLALNLTLLQFIFNIVSFC